MVTDSTNQNDDTTAFLRAARSGNLEKVVEYLDTSLDINTANSNGLNALHLASKDGHVEIVIELLKRGAKVDAATKKGNTALHIASLAGQSEIVNILIQYGAAVNIQSQNGFTPLYMAAQENHDQVVKLLLSNGANQSLATEDGFTPLAVAMQQGHDKVVSVLLENDSKGKVRLPALHIAAKKDDCKAADLLLQNDHKPDVTSKSGFTPLHIAAHYGNEEIGRLLIKRGADVNYLAKHNISPLHVAAKWGKNNMVKLLLENSAMIDAKTRDGLTPLHCAARSGHEEVVSTLLELSAPISARTKNGLAPLHMASQGDHVDAARVLLYHRAPVDEVTIDYLTSLHVAAHCGHVRVAKLLLDRKADPNARALNGFTPLHIACKKNRIKVVELLLKHGASIESTTESGLTPLHVASFMGCMNIVIFLLQHEANPDVPTVRGETPLHLAARANQTDIIRILLRNGAKVDARAREEQTPLHIASRLGNVDIVMLLLQHGAAVDTTTKDMYTALHIAAKEGQEEVAAILVENQASVKATTKNGFTPLHIAAKYGNMNVAKILLQKDSKLDSTGKNDITPLHLACHYDHPEVANMIIEKGASPHLSSQNGHTPLHIAARKNQMEIASTLLEHGADPNAQSKAGFTPLQLSAQKGHYDMTNLLIEHGANTNHKARNGLTALHLCAQEDFIRVASILVKSGANVESETESGYRPIHVASHFGNLSMIRFLLKHNAQIDVGTSQKYTPLHQAAQQGHAHIASALLEGNATHNARTNDGLTALNIAQKLGYISVMEVLKGLPYDTQTLDNKYWEEKYKVIAPESIQETSFMSDSDDEGGSDALINEQPYRYLTADLMKSLRDDSLPIDVTRDDPVHRPVSKEEIQEFTQSNNYCLAENFDSTDGINTGKLHFRSFLVSFLVDARGGAMKGCRHSGIRIVVPPRRATMPIRVTCRLVKTSKVANPPLLMEGEALATRIVEMGPVGAPFLGPVLIDVPHFAAIEGRDREIVVLRSDNGESWKEHDSSHENDDALFNSPHDTQMNSFYLGRITRIITTEFPQYFAIVTRIKQEVHVIGSDGGILISSVANHVQAVFPPGALTKKIKVGLQAHVIPAELTAKLLGNCVAVSPVITIEPRRRKFHKPITLTIPVPQAANKGMINHYGGETPTLRLLCSIAGGTSEAQWEDVTGSTPLTFLNDRVSFTTTVSARFWLMDCRNISEVPKMATDLYKESLFVPFITNFIIYTKRMDLLEATLRILCMTDGKEGMHTLERQEEFLEIVKSRNVEALDGKDLYIEFSGNLVPVTKSGQQLKFTFKAFRQNRLSFHVKVRDHLLDPVARMMFMKDPKVAKGDPSQQPICVLNIVLPDEISSKSDSSLNRKELDSNLISKMDIYKSTYMRDYGEKRDIPKPTSPNEKKLITDIFRNEQTDAATIHDSFAQKMACPLESVDASYPSNLSTQGDISPELERQTYSEKRKFWEDITKKRENYQRSESEVSRASQLTVNESDSEYLQNVVSEEEEEDIEIIPEVPETLEDLPDISECTVAEKAHYFEEQIQKEISSTSKPLSKLSSQDSVNEKQRSSIDSSQSTEQVEGRKEIIGESGTLQAKIFDDENTIADLNAMKFKVPDIEKKKDEIERKVIPGDRSVIGGESRSYVDKTFEKTVEEKKTVEITKITNEAKSSTVETEKIVTGPSAMKEVSAVVEEKKGGIQETAKSVSSKFIEEEQQSSMERKIEKSVEEKKTIEVSGITNEIRPSVIPRKTEPDGSALAKLDPKDVPTEKKVPAKLEPGLKDIDFGKERKVCSDFIAFESKFSQDEMRSTSEMEEKKQKIESVAAKELKRPSSIPGSMKSDQIMNLEQKTTETKLKEGNLSSKRESPDSSKRESKIPTFNRESSDSTKKEIKTSVPPKAKQNLPPAKQDLPDLSKKELVQEGSHFSGSSRVQQDISSLEQKASDLSTKESKISASLVVDQKIPSLEQKSSISSEIESLKKDSNILGPSKTENRSSLPKVKSPDLPKKDSTTPVLVKEPSDLSGKDSKLPKRNQEPSDSSKKDSKIPIMKQEPSDLSKKDKEDSKIPALKREPSDLSKKESTISAIKREPSDLSKESKIPVMKREPSDVSKKDPTIPGLKRESSDLSKESKIPVMKREPSDLTKKDPTIPALKREPSDLSKESKIPVMKREPSDLSKKDSTSPGLKREPSDLSKKDSALPTTKPKSSDSSVTGEKNPTSEREPSSLVKKDPTTPALKRESSDLSKKDSKTSGIKLEKSDLSKTESSIKALKREPSDFDKKDSAIPALKPESSDSSEESKIPVMGREPSDLSKRDLDIPAMKPTPSGLSQTDAKVQALKQEPSNLTKEDSKTSALKRESSDLSKESKIPGLKREPSDLSKESKIPVMKREPSDLSKKDSSIPTIKREPSDLSTESKIPIMKREPSDLSKKDPTISGLKRESSDLTKESKIPVMKREPSDLSTKDSSIPAMKREPSDLSKMDSSIPAMKREPSDLSKESKIPVMKREPSDLSKRDPTISGLKRESSDLTKESKIPVMKREPSDLSKKDSSIPAMKREPSDLSKESKIPVMKREPSDLSKKDPTISGLKRESSDLTKESKIPVMKREPSDLTKKDSTIPAMKREPSDLSKESKIPVMKREPSDLTKKDATIPALKREPSDLSKESKIPVMKREPSDLSKKDSKVPLMKREPSDLSKKESKIPVMKREPSDLSKKESSPPGLKREPSDLSKKDSKIPGPKRESSDLSKKDSKIPTFKREPSDLAKKESKAPVPSSSQGTSALKREPSDLSKKDPKISAMKREPSDLSKKDSKIPAFKRESSDLSKKDSKIPAFKRESSDLSKKDSKIPGPKRESSDLSKKDSKIPGLKRESSDLSKKDSKIPGPKRESSDLSKKDSKIPGPKRESSDLSKKDSKIPGLKRESSDLSKKDSKIPVMKRESSDLSKKGSKASTPLSTTTDQAKSSTTETTRTGTVSELVEKYTSEKKQSQTITTTFTDPIEALKEFEEMEKLLMAAPSVTTSQIDHKESKKVETKEVISSEISRGDEKILKLEEKERMLEEKSFESTRKKQSQDEILEDKLSSQKKTDIKGVQEVSVTLSGGKQFIEASASQSMSFLKDKGRIQSRDDGDEKLVKETGSTLVKDRQIDTTLLMEKDESKSKEEKEIDMFDLGMSLQDELQAAVVRDQTREESSERSETKIFLSGASSENVPSESSGVSKTLEEQQHKVAEENEARGIAENLVQQIEEEIVKRSESYEGLQLKYDNESMQQEVGDHLISESGDIDDLMADDLTKKFENMIGKRKESQAQVIDSVEQIRSTLLGYQDNLEKSSTRESFSISDDLTKDEESFPSSSSPHARMTFDDSRQITMSPSSISDRIEEMPREESRERMAPLRFEAYESTGARVLEILEPRGGFNTRQDSIDAPSIEIDDPRHFKDDDDDEDLSLGDRYLRDSDFGKLHESQGMSSLDKIGQDRDLTFSPSTVSESSMVHDFRSLSPPLQSSKFPSELGESDDAGFSSMEPEKTPEKIANVDINNVDRNIMPSIVSPRIKVAELDIKPGDWIIGDDKIAITENLEPSLAFDRELDEYQSSIIMQQSITSSLDGSTERESVTRSSDDISTVDSVRESTAIDSSAGKSSGKIGTITKFEIEHELVENKLDISCQELVATLQREHEAKTPSDERIPVTPRKTSESDSELELVEQSLENVKKVQMLPSSFDEKSLEVSEIEFDPLKSLDMTKMESFKGIPTVQETFEENAASKEKSEKEEKEIDTQDIPKTTGPQAPFKSAKETKRHPEKSPEKSQLKLKKDLPPVELTSRYAITVLDQVVKKEIAEVKESLEAAKQDLIEELGENSQTVFQIKDSPSEFQFKLQPESIPNDLPFLYKAPSLEQESPIAKPRKQDSKPEREEKEENDEDDDDEEEEEEEYEDEQEYSLDHQQYEDKTGSERSSKSHDRASLIPVPASRSSSDADKDKEESSSLSAPPQPAPRRRQKPTRVVKKLNTESEGGSSSESSHYQSCDYEIGSGSRPSSSDIDALQSASGLLSGTVSEYETALMSIEHSSASRPTSQDYQSALSTLSSRESMKSLNSFSSGRLGSIDSTSEHTDTLVASEPEMDRDEIDENLEMALEDDTSESDMPFDDSFDKTSEDMPRKMKRSSEMVFEKISEDPDSSSLAGPRGGSMEDDSRGQSTKVTSSIIMSEDDDQKTSTLDAISEGISAKAFDSSSTDSKFKPIEAQSTGDDIDPSELKMSSSVAMDANEALLLSKRSVLQQASMSTSSASGMSTETVIEREKLDRHSPDSDSFELVDKPDIIDDFVVIEEVGKEAEEFDAEGKSISISAIPQSALKKFDRDLENLITVKKEDAQISASQVSRNNELFDFESEESPPQASNEDQYSHSLSDDEGDHKKWMEMQFQGDPRAYEMEYDRGPLEDIKEEEITDFEAGSSRFGSLGSHKGSLGSSGSMKGSYGTEYDFLGGRKVLSKSIEHDNISLSSLQEFESLESAVAGENARRLQQCGSQDSVNNGSLPRRYTTSRSGHGDDVSVSSLKDFEGLEKACREAHMIELRAKEEEDLLDHESPENRYRLENLPKPKPAETSAAASFNPSTSGSDDYEKRIMEIDEIIRIAQANVEKFDRQDDTTEDISQIEITEPDKNEQVTVAILPESEDSLVKNREMMSAMETSTDSLELEGNADRKNFMGRSSDSLELKTAVDFPSLSYSDSLNNVREAQSSTGQFNNARRISSDSLEMPLLEQSDLDKSGPGTDDGSHRQMRSDSSIEVKVTKNGKTTFTATTDA